MATTTFDGSALMRRVRAGYCSQGVFGDAEDDAEDDDSLVLKSPSSLSPNHLALSNVGRVLVGAGNAEAGAEVALEALSGASGTVASGRRASPTSR
jgi:hypothetical protein